MKIISKFVDFYDWAVPQDDSPVFRRLEDPAIDTEHVKCPAFPRIDIFAEKYVLWFCGKSYVWVKTREGEFLTPPEWPAYQAARRLASPAGKSCSVRKHRAYVRHCERTAERWQRKWGKKVPLDPFLAMKSPTLLFTGVWMESYPVNKLIQSPCDRTPKLKSVGFSKFMEPHIAYQEIDMFLGNQLAERMDPPVTISDEDRMAKKGFDKTSFRASPGYKPNRKRRKHRT